MSKVCRPYAAYTIDGPTFWDAQNAVDNRTSKCVPLWSINQRIPVARGRDVTTHVSDTLRMPSRAETSLHWMIGGSKEDKNGEDIIRWTRTSNLTFRIQAQISQPSEWLDLFDL